METKMVCPKCNCYYEPLKNGVNVFDIIDGDVVTYSRADLWYCPICKNEVVSGFGGLVEDETFSKDIHEQSIVRGEKVYYVRNNQGVNPVEGSGYGMVQKVYDFRKG